MVVAAASVVVMEVLSRSPPSQATKEEDTIKKESSPSSPSETHIFDLNLYTVMVLSCQTYSMREL